MATVWLDSFLSYAAAGDLTKRRAVVQSPWQWVAGAGPFGGAIVKSVERAVRHGAHKEIKGAFA